MQHLLEIGKIKYENDKFIILGTYNLHIYIKFIQILINQDDTK